MEGANTRFAGMLVSGSRATWGTAGARAESFGARLLATQGIDLGRCMERVTGIEPAWPAWKVGAI